MLIIYKKYLGEGKEFKISYKTSFPEIFGLVSGKVESIKVDAPARVHPGEKVELTGTDVFGLKSVVRVDVYNPDGESDELLQ